MIDWSGKRRWLALLLLLAGVAVTLLVRPVIPVIQLPGEVYPSHWKLFGQIEIADGAVLGSPMTNTVMGSIVVWLLIILLILYIRSRMPKSDAEAPRGGFYNLLEASVDGLYSFVGGIVKPQYLQTIFRVFITIFVIVLLSNWLELIPGVDSIGFIHPHYKPVVDAQTGVGLVDDEGHQKYKVTDGYEIYRGVLGFWMVNGSCEWVSRASEVDSDRAAFISAVNAAQLAQRKADLQAAAGEAVSTEGVLASHYNEAYDGHIAAKEARAKGCYSGTTVSWPEFSLLTFADDGSAIINGQAVEKYFAALAPDSPYLKVDPHDIKPGDANSQDVPWVVLPYVRVPSTDINMTIALALAAVAMTQVMGFRALGIGYLTKFFNFRTLFTSPLGGIDVAVGLLELIGEIARILSFAFRLLGNIFAGSILLFVMSYLVTILPWPFFILEFFVGLIQALVFGMLTAIFMNLATDSHHHEEHEAH